ncbi:mitochondrial carrier homolog 2-like [Paramacrobiotus metropolitanus]|uniref:mitochondrial carrier homolog 2-like n=1 Tax=Paramacrobiotus metropolitanus TaxID=2943436 RepID=UPI0024460F49|nr:mitochondrial carrier homolog 2-like [Paramacrobiotus metropolitanus]
MDPTIIADVLHDVNPPNRLNVHPDDQEADAHWTNTADEESEQARSVETIVAWSLYGTQVTISTAIFHPLSYARILMELGFEPAPARPSRTVFGKPCLILPSIGTYVRAIKARDGRLGLWSGFGANLCSTLLSNVSNDMFYHLVDEFIKRKIRTSPRKAWSVFVLANQENQPYSIMDFVEDLSKEVSARVLSVSLSYPFQVLFVRTAAQFIWKERIYRGFFGSFVQIYQEEGFRGFYGGYVPYMMGEVGALVIVWVATFLFRSAITGDRVLLTVFRFATDYIARSFLYPFKLISRMMTLSTSRFLPAGSVLPNFTSWMECYKHLKAQNDLMRGHSIFMRVVTNGRPGIFEKYGYHIDSQTDYPVPVQQAVPKPGWSAPLPSQVMKPLVTRTERFFGSSSFRTVF